VGSQTASSAPYHVVEALLGLGEEQVRRKGNQNGSVRVCGDRWYAQFSRWVKDEYGNLVWKRTERAMEQHGKPVLAIGKDRVGKREAERLAYELYVAPANSANAVPQGLATVGQFIELRFRPDHILKLGPSGRAHYEHMLRAHVLPTLAGIQLRDVDADVVQRLLTAKSETYSSQTVLHIRNVISAVMRHARRLKFYSGELPTADLSLPTLRHAERRALRWDQVLMLVDKMPLRHRALVILLAQGGMRIGEAAGLNWSCCNFEDDWAIRDGIAIPSNTVCIRYNWTRGELKDLKGSDKVRMVPMTAEVWVALQLHRERSKWCGEDQPVFAGQTGSRLDAHNVGQRSLKTAGEAIGCPWVSWHVLRHTASTLGDIAGLTPAEKQKILGHRQLQMSIRYTHPEAEQVRGKLELIATPKHHKTA